MLPLALESGIRYSDFWHMTPRTINLCIKTYAKKCKEEMDRIEYQAWLSGSYVVSAIGTCFGKKYPENPLKRKISSDTEKKGSEKNEILAAAEMAMWAASLKNQGMPETKL